MAHEETQTALAEGGNYQKKPDLGLNPERIYEGPGLDFDLTPIFLPGEGGSEDSTSSSPALASVDISLDSPLPRLTRPSS